MAHRYRTLQLWDEWLEKFELGQDLLNIEQTLLTQLINKHYSHNLVLIGVPQQKKLLQEADAHHQTLLSPIANTQVNNVIEVDWQELPIRTGVIDLVVMPHALEFLDNPRQLLAEACRIIRPEGLIILFGFNPYSTWGLRKSLLRTKLGPWAANFLPAHLIKSWLSLLDFKLEVQKSVLYRPPIFTMSMYKKLHFVEYIGKAFFPPFGAVYAIVARAKVIPLTPIRLKWKQKLSGLSIRTIPGPIARQNR